VNLPGISVVVPTWNRSQHIAGLLASLGAAAERFEGESEILLVDDSDAAEALAIQQLCELHGARYIRGTASVRQKRNLGVEKAAHPVILFVDSDCRAAPDLFSQHARIHAEGDPSVAGVVGVTEFAGRESWMWEVIRRTQFLNAFSFARRMENAPWATCSNTSYCRDVLRELGGFDVGFPFRLCGDDVDLGIRVNAAGYRIRSNPEAVVTHTRETWDSFPEVWRRALRWGRMDVHLYFRKHRDRVELGMPKLSQVFLLLGLVSLAQAIATRSGWPLTLPFLWAGLSISLQAGVTVVSRREPWRCFVQELTADLLGLTFELGALFEGVWRRELAVLWKTVRRGPVLPGFERKEWLLQAWSMWLAVSLLLAMEAVLL
jgi:GT2 family glycosyltransferase